ncbi:beta-ketoacyl synthase [Micromonospora sp. STR1_7]|uniref:Beta-ketoacyl synthase n=1 Tax=Micromonospora parastrephiae TaxID=2806101 RepID=A0ABS1XQ59_9ACTN|nr:type I polyketide synthase [Micromonospora parastrephiae]MBM0231392.1 beta-ketoacyl synthase [Micromonospora parastrephiae]
MSQVIDEERIRRLMSEQLELSRRLRARIRELEGRNNHPLAVVGLGVRMPGGLDTPEQYWDFLCDDGLALSPIPTDRPGLRDVFDPRPGTPGRSYVDQAGFHPRIAEFDADFFGISHREAELLDPQQRMLLEVAWEAMERAGIAVRRKDRLDVGVFLGIMASEYTERLENRGDTSRIDPYYTTGGGLCFAAGRICHVMGFSGPTVSVDTACSSSLTALHLAVRAVRAGDCRYALVCGANLLLSANLMVSLCQTGALAADGRSKSFLASADGYGRAEGVGAVVLMRLERAEREGRPILAVVRGTATNHDGAASSLTAPNGQAQQEVITAALADAGVRAEEVGWVEAHGTGTPLGDPVEVGALDGALGEAVRRRGTPLLLGSVKARLGHLEAASGIAALIKTVLTLRHGEIPAAVGQDDGELNPRIPWGTMRFEVPRRKAAWPRSLARKVAGINSFGMSGTNVHAVLEAYEPEPAGSPDAAPRPELLVLSARSPAALFELAGAVSERLRNGDPTDSASICHTLRVGRVPFTYRLAVVGATSGELATGLAAATSAPAHRPVRAVRCATLVVPGDSALVTAACATIARAFPLLASETQPASVNPVLALAHLVGGLGVRVDVRRAATDDRSDTVAWLEWETDRQPHRQALVEGPESVWPQLFLRAVAELFLSGAELRLDTLRAPGARLVGDLPTYPFQRRRFWIDEPAAVGFRPSERSGAAVPLDAAVDPRDRESVEADLAAALRGVLGAREDPDPTLSFLDVGGDSFTFAEFTSLVGRRYGHGAAANDLSPHAPLSELVATIADDVVTRAGG